MSSEGDRSKLQMGVSMGFTSQKRESSLPSPTSNTRPFADTNLLRNEETDSNRRNPTFRASKEGSDKTRAGEQGSSHLETEDRKRPYPSHAVPGKHAGEDLIPNNTSSRIQRAGPLRRASLQETRETEENDAEHDSKTAADEKVAAERARKRRNSARSRQYKKEKIDRLRTQITELERSEQELLTERSHLKGQIAALKNKPQYAVADSRSLEFQTWPSATSGAVSQGTASTLRESHETTGFGMPVGLMPLYPNPRPASAPLTRVIEDLAAQHMNRLQAPLRDTTGRSVEWNLYPSAAQELPLYSDAALQASRYLATALDSTPPQIPLYDLQGALRVPTSFGPSSPSLTSHLQQATIEELVALAAILEAKRNAPA